MDRTLRRVGPRTATAFRVGIADGHRSTRMRSSGADLGLPTFDPKLCTKSHAILNQGDVPPDVRQHTELAQSQVL